MDGWTSIANPNPNPNPIPNSNPNPDPNQVRFASLEGCVTAAITGRVPRAAPGWCGDGVQKPPRLRDGGATPLAPLAPLTPLAPLAPLASRASRAPLAQLAIAPARRALHTHVAPAAVRALRRVLR